MNRGTSGTYDPEEEARIAEWNSAYSRDDANAGYSQTKTCPDHRIVPRLCEEKLKGVPVSAELTEAEKNRAARPSEGLIAAPCRFQKPLYICTCLWCSVPQCTPGEGGGENLADECSVEVVQRTYELHRIEISILEVNNVDLAVLEEVSKVWMTKVKDEERERELRALSDTERLLVHSLSRSGPNGSSSSNMTSTILVHPRATDLYNSSTPVTPKFRSVLFNEHKNSIESK
ncbi:hypothetical protein C7974DRAFT_421807 [Boeremia exigua]|uniref:uncharacterized protein n=1 Tax=Boeremia exigua TaxID=749465 RepID=UPI001E8CAEE8|nr:uncharacterized protein C7974DRAFT_421807 [Boeremia exigua]KAH6639215.1 hypothetical protein C7974DRAFT_421807 [Boeremia exigua]